MKTIINSFFIIVGLATLFYWIPYLIKRGWDSGANDVNPKKRKVCDVCFRDLKKINEYAKNKDL